MNPTQIKEIRTWLDRQRAVGMIAPGDLFRPEHVFVETEDLFGSPNSRNALSINRARTRVLGIVSDLLRTVEWLGKTSKHYLATRSERMLSYYQRTVVATQDWSELFAAGYDNGYQQAQFDSEFAISWGTNCLACANRTEQSYNETVRAEIAEQRIRQLASYTVHRPTCDGEICTCGLSELLRPTPLPPASLPFDAQPATDQ